jgi:ubiquinone/menaquinone biosynthesis C-methylase UbiE
VTLSALTPPRTDATPVFEAFRGNYATELLTAAVAHFHLFSRLAQSPRTLQELGGDLGLASRPVNVLVTALRALGLLGTNKAGQLTLTDLAREHLVPGSPFDVGDYVGLAADGPGVRAMVERLRTNRPAAAKEDAGGTAFIYREGTLSAMEHEQSARHFTLALAGRAKNVAPVLAEKVPLAGAKTLIDVGGGSGIYSIALVQKNPGLNAVIVDRPEVLKVAREMAQTYGVDDRIAYQPGDMFHSPLPRGDIVLLSNVLHDWDVPDCEALIKRCAHSLSPGGRLLIHDVFLNDELDGPLPIALYSAALFCLTEGRAYSAAEYRAWLAAAGLKPVPVTPTLIHCGVLAGLVADTPSPR